MKKQVLSMFSLMVFMLPFLGAAQAADDMAAQVAAKRAELNDHEWQVKVSSAADKTKIQEDTLIFKDQMFESMNMTKKGYKPTNYTVSIQEGGPTVWETMQSMEDGKAIFWRGEWEGDSMRGVMSKQLGEGKNEDYYFSSVSSKTIEKPVEPPPAVEEAVESAETAVEDAAAAIKEEMPKMEEPVPAPPVEEKPKKKKWF